MEFSYALQYVLLNEMEKLTKVVSSVVFFFFFLNPTVMIQKVKPTLNTGV